MAVGVRMDPLVDVHVLAGSGLVGMRLAVYVLNVQRRRTLLTTPIDCDGMIGNCGR